jgi:hypothetical protein
LVSGLDGECTGLGCGETGMSVDARFFKREPGMVRDRREGEGQLGKAGWPMYGVRGSSAKIAPLITRGARTGLPENLTTSDYGANT